MVKWNDWHPRDWRSSRHFLGKLIGDVMFWVCYGPCAVLYSIISKRKSCSPGSTQEGYVPAPPPPPSLFHKFKGTKRPFQELERKTKLKFAPHEHDPTAFPFLQLPAEIRSMIYIHAADVSSPHIQVKGCWQGHYCVGTSAWLKYLDRKETLPYELGDQSTEDAISFQVKNREDSIIAYHGIRPPPNLLLICKQIYTEAWDQFLTTTAFEVAPLTPHEDRYLTSLNSAYVDLAKSSYIRFLRKILVRVDLARMESYRITSTHYAYRPIYLGMCVSRVTRLAGVLCSVLETKAPNLRVVVVHWVDDYPDAMSEEELELKASILEPFAQLPGVQTRIEKLVIADRGRAVVQSMMHKVIGRTPVAS